MDESYFPSNRHMPATLKPGEAFSAAHFVNDPNRRAPPPMLRPGAGDPSAALEVGHHVARTQLSHPAARYCHATDAFVRVRVI
jgi:hypothetical protein